MASTFKTPGVYVREISTFPPSVAQVETAIPAFIGYTEKAIKDGESLTFKPLRISSLLEYEKFFGTAQPETHLRVVIDQITDGNNNVIEEAVNARFNSDLADNTVGPSKHNMYYALQIYFANGGGPCYIVSVGGFLGVFGQELPLDALQQGLDEIRKEDEPTLLVFPEAQGMSEANHFALIEAALTQCNELQDRFTIMDTHEGGEGLESVDLGPSVSQPVRDALTLGVDLNKYGAVYFPNIRSIFNYIYNDADVVIEQIIDGTPGGEFNGQQLSAINNKLTEAKVFAAIDAFSIFLPPSPAMAGIYARVDNARGVWKAPANENVLGISGLTFKVTDQLQEGLNVDATSGLSINAIRAFTGRGTLVWGARTMAGNDNEWRYISVRRFFNMVEESTKKASARFVFEPNDANTWVRVKALIENFLVLQWRAGALAGATPEEAFFVNVGLNETMTAIDILEGRMIVEIGMAVVRPAEFIILKFSHKMQES